MTHDIAVLVGSLRHDGFSSRLAHALTVVGGDRLHLRQVSIGDLPLYNQDFDDVPPAPWTAFREAIRPAAAVLFVTPEYNRSIPAPLKNAVDVGSRPYGQSVFVGKPAAVISQSPGAMGGFGANHALRQSLMFLDMPTLQQPEAYLAHSDKLLGPRGALLDESSGAFLASFMAAFADWVDRCRGAGDGS
jgi:chromate reductase